MKSLKKFNFFSKNIVYLELVNTFQKNKTQSLKYEPVQDQYLILLILGSG